MDSDPASRAARKHANGWMTVLALGLLAVGLLACLYVLIGFPAEAQAVGGSTESTQPLPGSCLHPVRPSVSLCRLRSAGGALPVSGADSGSSLRTDAACGRASGGAGYGSRPTAPVAGKSAASSPGAAQDPHRVGAFLAVFAVIAALIVIQVYLQARAWDGDSSRAVAEVQAVAAN